MPSTVSATSALDLTHVCSQWTSSRPRFSAKTVGPGYKSSRRTPGSLQQYCVVVESRASRISFVCRVSTDKTPLSIRIGACRWVRRPQVSQKPASGTCATERFRQQRNGPERDFWPASPGSPSWPMTSESLVIRPQSVSSADNLQTSPVGGNHPRLPWECCPRGPDEVSSLHLECFLNECKSGCPHQPKIIVEDDLDWYFVQWSLHAALLR